MAESAVERVNKVAQKTLEGNGNDDPASDSYDSHPGLCILYDNLIEEIGREKRHQLYIASFRIIALNGKTLEEFSHLFASAADHCRGVIGLSLCILQGVPSTDTKSGPTVTHLKNAVHQSTLLLQLLSAKYSLLCGCYEGTSIDEKILPTNLPMLQAWVDVQKQQNRENGLDDMTPHLISFDKEILTTEEEQLLQMANTPTPSERPWNSQPAASGLDPPELVARMSASYLTGGNDQSSVQIVMDHRGLLLVRDQTKGHDWWAALMGSSTTQYVFPVFTINSILLSTASSQEVNNSSIALQVGSDGNKWWDAASIIIQKLKEIEFLQEKIEMLWPTEEVDQQATRARGAIQKHRAAFN